ncbi:unnamed protein product [Cyclocybe aegerita]|uniref:NAD-dependent epimerase/dehydratase domain-containing protein n=1 Tax=Cyclocybe aegerita TaxID=1973307 RepID=A0A8S0XPN9_CYCAE|nr:unnamed protein product [Cyclocybe aegerita]
MGQESSAPQGGKALVSGANGYIGMWTVQTLLERRCSVRGTVRSVDKGKYLSDYFSKAGFGDKFEVVVVEDFSKEGAFDEAVKGVDAILHTASPFHWGAKNPQVPAVGGTSGVLNSALKYAPNVKRIVITSSCAALINTGLSKPTVFTEEGWNETAVKEAEEQGDKTHPGVIYCAAKVLAERFAWKFYEEHKSEVGWGITTILPAFVVGPPIQDVSSPTSLNQSLQMWYDNVLSGSAKKATLAQANTWVDVRDIALAHVLAMENKATGGERIIAAAGVCLLQDWVETANALQPNPLPSCKLSVGFPETLEGERVYHMSYSKAKEERILGIKFRTMEETTRAIFEEFAKRGW